jgi:hypothetical protein
MTTHEDAAIVVQLLQWGAQIGVEDAYNAIYDERFDPASAEPTDPDVRKVLIFGETLGAFVAKGALDSELVYALFAWDLSWSRVGPAAMKARERFNAPSLYDSYEALAKGSHVVNPKA